MGRSPPKTGGWRRAHCAWALVLCLVGHVASAAVPDVRVLVDISASMKANDADNLRVPAVGGLIERLPEGSRAGVWTFGRYVNMLVPYGEVDAAWRIGALEAVAAIGSVAVHSDLESAIDTATWNWVAPDGGDARHLLVIADGPIELPGADANRQSRDRILGAVLPRLRAAGARIHVFDLGAAADRDLLTRLASETGGRYQRADAAMLPALLGELLHRDIAPPVRATPAGAWKEAMPESPGHGATMTLERPSTADPGRDWTRIGLGVMILNLILGGGLLVAYRLLARPAPDRAGAAAPALPAAEPHAESTGAEPPEAAEAASEPTSADDGRPTAIEPGTGPDGGGDASQVTTSPARAGDAGAQDSGAPDTVTLKTVTQDTTAQPTPGSAAPAAIGMMSADAAVTDSTADVTGDDPPGAVAPGGIRYEALEDVDVAGIDVDRIELDFSDSGHETAVAAAGRSR